MIPDNIVMRASHQPIIAMAPMLRYTDRHFRYLLRLIAPNTILYTEMYTSDALTRGQVDKLLAYNPAEHPVAVQLAGHHAQDLAWCARLAEAMGYDEINFNVACPSSRVKSGNMGACLMLVPDKVAECVAAMQAAVKIPVTVKCRLGVDDHDSYAYLHNFVATVAAAGCQRFIIHARKAYLRGLNPKQNRSVPPLRYAWVAQLQQDFPHLSIIINGGIVNVAMASELLKLHDGIMIGRQAYSNPYLMAHLEQHYFANKIVPLSTVLSHYMAYINEQITQGIPLRVMTRHLYGLWHQEAGAKFIRQELNKISTPSALDDFIRGLGLGLGLWRDVFI